MAWLRDGHRNARALDGRDKEQGRSNPIAAAGQESKA
jgi:hypothetical protein